MDSHLDFLASRRSIRQLRTDPVAEDVVWRILQAANAAPSAHNAQPWRFVLVEPGSRAMLAERLAGRLTEHLTVLGETATDVSRQVQRVCGRLQNAPVAILVCLDEASVPEPASRTNPDGERTLAVQGVALAAGWLLLAAHAEGLGAFWYSGPLFVPADVREVLSLPSGFTPQAMVLMGHPAGPDRLRKRRDVRELTLRR